MRLYTFTNFYLSSIQQGIQPLHVVGELVVKYPNELHDVRSVDHIFHDWAKNHKTVICLNGGNNAELQNIYAQLENICPILKLPYARFYEDEDSLGGVLTCVGVVVPARIYEYNELVRNTIGTSPEMFNYQIQAGFVDADLKLISLLSNYGLAK